MDSRPIGIFDSGVGGLTVAHAIMEKMPGEAITFIGDTAHSPYGTKPIAEVRRLALDIMDRLVASNVKMLVIACNTATAAALADARERYRDRLGIPVVEVIRPAVRRAIRTTQTGRVGVIATPATIKSGSYQDAFAAADIQLCTQACPAFVELAESGVTAGPDVERVAEEYLRPVRDFGVDTLVLGCTHYPLLSGVISYTMGEDVTLVTSSEETAKDVYRTLASHKLFSDASVGGATVDASQLRFYTTGDPAQFGRLARRFVGPEVGRARSAKELE